MSLETNLGAQGQTNHFAYPSEAEHRKIVAGGSFTVPRNKTGISPSSGQASAIPVTGALIYAVDHNDPNLVPMQTFKPRVVNPGQIIALTVAANVYTLSIGGVQVFQQTGTALTYGSVSFFVQ